MPETCNIIFFKVLEKSRLSPLPPSTSTLVSLDLDTTGSNTSGNFPSSEKLVHWLSLEKEIGVWDHLKGHGMADSIVMISQE
jgi:hypothetical protein